MCLQLITAYLRVLFSAACLSLFLPSKLCVLHVIISDTIHLQQGMRGWEGASGGGLCVAVSGRLGEGGGGGQFSPGRGAEIGFHKVGDMSH